MSARNSLLRSASHRSSLLLLLSLYQPLLIVISGDQCRQVNLVAEGLDDLLLHRPSADEIDVEDAVDLADGLGSLLALAPVLEVVGAAVVDHEAGTAPRPSPPPG